MGKILSVLAMILCMVIVILFFGLAIVSIDTDSKARSNLYTNCLDLGYTDYIYMSPSDQYCSKLVDGSSVVIRYNGE